MGWLPHLHLKSRRLNSTNSASAERPMNKQRFHRSESATALLGKEDSAAVPCIGDVLHNVLQQALLGAEQHLVTIFQNREDELLKEIATLKQQHEALTAENDHLLEIIGIRKETSRIPETPRKQETSRKQETPRTISSCDVPSQTSTNCPQIFDIDDDTCPSSKKMDTQDQYQFSPSSRKIDSQGESTTLNTNNSSDEEFGNEFQCRGVPRSAMDISWLPRAARERCEVDTSSTYTSSSSSSRPQMNTTTLNAVMEVAERVVNKTLQASMSCSPHLGGLDRNDLRV